MEKICYVENGKLLSNCFNFLLQYICHHLKDMFGVNCNRKNIIDLDSRCVPNDSSKRTKQNKKKGTKQQNSL